jgi:hypothetical protein
MVSYWIHDFIYDLSEWRNRYADIESYLLCLMNPNPPPTSPSMKGQIKMSRYQSSEI